MGDGLCSTHLVCAGHDADYQRAVQSATVLLECFEGLQLGAVLQVDPVGIGRAVSHLDDLAIGLQQSILIRTIYANYGELLLPLTWNCCSIAGMAVGLKPNTVIQRSCTSMRGAAGVN